MNKDIKRYPIMMITLLVCLSNILCFSDSDSTKVGSGTSGKDTTMGRMRGVVGEIVRLAMMEILTQTVIENMDRIIEEAFKDVTSGVIDTIYGGMEPFPEAMVDPMIVKLTDVIFAEIYSGTKDMENIDLEEIVGGIIRDIPKSISLSLVKTNISKKLKDLLTKQSPTTMLGYFSPPNRESPEVDPKTQRVNDLLNLFKEFNDSKMKDREKPPVEEKEKGFREIFNKVFGGICTIFYYNLIDYIRLICISKEDVLNKLYEEFKRGSMLFYGSEESDKKRGEFIKAPENFAICKEYSIGDSRTFFYFNGSNRIVKGSESITSSDRICDAIVFLYRFEIKDPTTPSISSQDPNPTTSSEVQ